MLKSILNSSVSEESDAISLNKKVDKDFQSSKNKVFTEQRNTDIKFIEKLKTLVKIKNATKKTSQKYNKCTKMCDFLNFR